MRSKCSSIHFLPAGGGEEGDFKILTINNRIFQDMARAKMCHLYKRLWHNWQREQFVLLLWTSAGAHLAGLAGGRNLKVTGAYWRLAPVSAMFISQILHILSAFSIYRLYNVFKRPLRSCHLSTCRGSLEHLAKHGTLQPHKFLWLNLEHLTPFETSRKSEHWGKKGRQQLATPITSMFMLGPSSQVQAVRGI